MKKHILFSIVSLLLVSAVFFSLAPSVHASDYQYQESTDIFTWLASHTGFVGKFLTSIVSPGCSVSDDGRHKAKSYYLDNGSGAVRCQCEFCGQSFTAPKDVLQDAYNSYVNDVQDQLGTTTVGNNGFCLPIYVDNNCDVISHPGYTSSASWSTGVDVDFYFRDSDKAPVDGTYVLHYSVSNSNCSIQLSAKDGKSVVLSKGSVLEEAFGVYSRIYLLFRFRGQYKSSSSAVVSAWFDVTPFEYSVNDFTFNIGGIDSRTGSITGGLGIIGDNGTINQFNNYVFNEETNYYYSPSTNTNQTVNEWQYDYTTRSYTLKLDDGREITVTYGDDYILVLEDGQEYKIYYLMDGEGGGEDPGPTPGPSGHVHNYTSKTTQNPTCTGTGTRTYTCQECGETYTEEIPALGHSWQAVETVDPEYGEDGSVVKEGYTLYRCSVCQEEYKDTTGSGPPDSGPNTPGGVLGWFQKIYNKLCDILEAITGLELSPEIDVDVEVDQDGQQQDQQSWFTSFVGKFAWLSDASKIYRQLVADVTSDAATASLVAEGSVSLDEVTGDHAAIAGNTRLTAPELAISFGSSDKYGVDWDSIQPVDLSWYTPYKKTVDSIVSGILWATYIFLLIKRAPGIIQGAEMVTEDSIKISKW